MKSVIIIILCVLTVSVLFGQETKEEVFFSRGSRALLFSFSGLSFLNADEFNGGIGGKYFLNDNVALRVGLNFDYSSTTTPANADTSQMGEDGSASSMEFGISAAVEWHLTRGRVSPYLGGGAMYSNRSTEQYSAAVWANNDPGPIYRTTFETTGISTIEVFGIAGVEVFITKGVSLAAEYHLRYRYASNGDNDRTVSVIHGELPPGVTLPDFPTVEGNTVSHIGFTTGGALTLAVYF